MGQALKQAFVWMDNLFQDLRLPGVSKSTFIKRPSLRHRGKSIISSKDGELPIVHCRVEIKEVLIEAEAEIYHQTDHYKGYPALLMRPEKLVKEILRMRIEAAWHFPYHRLEGFCPIQPILDVIEGRVWQMVCEAVRGRKVRLDSAIR